jgi:nitroreductase
VVREWATIGRCSGRVTNLILDAPILSPLLRERWSPRSFDPQHELSAEDVSTLLEAAQWAPSAGNSQPWYFLVTRRGDRSHQAIVAALARGNLSWVPQASAVLIAVAHVRTGIESDAPDYSDYAEYDVGQAVAHLTIQARALGLDTRQFAGFDHDSVAGAFAVPENFKVLVGIAVGRHLPPVDTENRHLAREQRPRTRKEVVGFAFSETWGRAWVSAEPTPASLDGQ